LSGLFLWRFLFAFDSIAVICIPLLYRLSVAQEVAASLRTAGGRESGGAVCAAVGKKQAGTVRRSFCRAPQTSRRTVATAVAFPQKSKSNRGTKKIRMSFFVGYLIPTLYGFAVAYT